MQSNNQTTENSISEKETVVKPKHSKPFLWALFILAELVIIFAVFSLGVNVGFHKAGFTYSWEKNYRHNFGQPGMQTMMIVKPNPNQFLNAYGVDGNILSLAKDAGSLVIKDEKGTEKTVLISSMTVVRQDFQNLKPTDLKTNEEILVLGEPNEQGQIQAKFIRILDEKK